MGEEADDGAPRGEVAGLEAVLVGMAVAVGAAEGCGKPGGPPPCHANNAEVT
jgi:hypothetical protein